MSEFRKLYIANTTKQHQEFMYRLPPGYVNGSDNRMYMDRIPAGGQIRVYKEAPDSVLEYIIRQHQDCPKPFLISVDEMSRNRGHIGLIYQFDKEININQIERKMRENDEALVEQGKQIRKEQAAALSRSLTDQAQESGVDVGTVRTEIVEDVRKGESEEGKIAEGVEVRKEAEKRGPGRPRK